MTSISSTPKSRRQATASGFSSPLPQSGQVVVWILVIAQAAFAGYLLGSYGRSTWRGDVAAWARFSSSGWVPGDRVGNTAMSLHVLVAILVLLAGAAQLLPAIRHRWPALHRWSGRMYLLGCITGSVSGLALVWGRGTVGDRSQHVAISINAMLLIACAAQAWRTARAGNVAAHRTWAIRTYLVAGGVLYFRLLFAFWLVLFRRPVGFDAHTFSGPFLTALALTVYVFGPITLFELYRRTQRGGRRAVHVTVAWLMYGVALLLAAGTLSAALVLWLPRVGAY